MVAWAIISDFMDSSYFNAGIYMYDNIVFEISTVIFIPLVGSGKVNQSVCKRGL